MLEEGSRDPAAAGDEEAPALFDPTAGFVEHRKPACLGTSKIGHIRVLYGDPLDRNNSKFPRSCLVGPDWCCLVAAFVMILTPSFAWLSFVLTSSVTILVPIGGCVTLGGTLLFLSMTAFSNPGIVPRGPELPENVEVSSIPRIRGQEVYCLQCNVYRPRRAYHCSSCDVCVKRLDHHCPWTGLCIGEGNLSTFHWYLTFLGIHLVYVFVSSFATLISLKPNRHRTGL